MSEFQGIRLPDTRFGETPTTTEGKSAFDIPGCYWRILNRKTEKPAHPNDLYPDHNFSSNLTGQVWSVVTPNGLWGNLTLHTVREHDDGTISVRPGDGSSNSILVEGAGGKSYHGYIEHGVWTEC